jgi:large subunit ribosomal protein L22
MEVRAQLRTLRMSPRKVQLVVQTIRGLPAQQALASLQFAPQAAAREVWKVVRSAIANAENNYGLDPALLVVTSAVADQGPGQGMRYRAKARGQAGPIKKRTTHITVIVDDEARPARRSR